MYGTRAIVSAARVIREGGKKWHLECMNAVHPFSHVHPTVHIQRFTTHSYCTPVWFHSRLRMILRPLSCLQKIYGACVNERKTIAKGRGTLYFCD